MLIYILKRLLAMIPTLLGISFVTFLIINLAPGDPVATSMGAGGEEKSTESGGGQGRDRLADAIRAKKRLLGIVKEDRAVLGWDVPEAEKAPLVDQQDPTAVAERLREAGRLGELGGWARALALSPDGGTLYAGGEDHKIYVIDVVKGDVARTIEGHAEEIWSLAISPEDNELVSADASGVIRIWNAATGEGLSTLPALGRPVRALVFFPDGQRFLSACDDGMIRAHAAKNGAVQSTYEGHIAGVYGLAMARDGSRFWSAGYDRKLREWAPGQPKPVAVFGEHQQAINALALSSDGTRLATGSDDRLIRIFSTTRVTTGEEPAPLVLKGHYKAVTTLTFSNDGKTLFSGGRDETIRSWSLEKGGQTTQTKDSSGVVNALLVSRDGKVLWSGAETWVKVPVYIRFGIWLKRIATLDFDRSFVDDRMVIEKIGDALPVTIGLNSLALLIIYLVSIPVGILGAVKRDSLFDHLSSLILFILYSIPNFWFATILIMVFSSKRNWDILPSVGVEPQNPFDLSYLQWLGGVGLHLVLPVTVLVYAGFASLSRYARTAMLETIGQDYVRTARAKGLPERIVVYKHAFRNSLITIVTLIANLLPAMIGGSVIVEYIFSIHGMGKLGFDAILARDYPVIMAITTFSALLTLLGILISDLLYSVVDPRITHS